MTDLPACVEYSDPRYEANRSIRTVIAEGVRKVAAGRNDIRDADILRLVHKTAGYWIAGSAATLQNEGWGCILNIDGTPHGRWFKDEAQARKFFADHTIAA